MGHSLSKESQVVLKAASKGDADLLDHYLSTHPALIKSVTLLKRSSILHLAAREGYPDIITACLQPYITAVRSEISTDAYPGPACQKLRKVINSRDVYYRTPLIVAAKKGQLDCVRVVVERAANLFAIDRDANTCLHYAALYGHTQVVEYLIHKTRSREHGPGGRDLLDRFLNKRNICGFSALHYAIWRGHVAVVRLLLNSGADTNHANDRVFDPCVPVPIGSTPMHLAVVQNNSTIVLMLLEHYAMQMLDHTPNGRLPADPRSAVNLYGLNPAQLASHMRNRAMARLLLPGVPITDLFTRSELSSLRNKGLMPLKVLASKAWQKHLLSSLATATAVSAAATAAAAGASGSSCADTTAAVAAALADTVAVAASAASSTSVTGVTAGVTSDTTGSDRKSSPVGRFSTGVTSIGALSRLVHMVQQKKRGLGRMEARSTSEAECETSMVSTTAAAAAVAVGAGAQPDGGTAAAAGAVGATAEGGRLGQSTVAATAASAALGTCDACGGLLQLSSAGSSDLEIVCAVGSVTQSGPCHCSSSSNIIHSSSSSGCSDHRHAPALAKAAAAVGTRLGTHCCEASSFGCNSTQCGEVRELGPCMVLLSHCRATATAAGAAGTSCEIEEIGRAHV